MHARILVLIAAVGCLLTAAVAQADMLDDYHSAPGTVSPRSATIPGRRIMVIGDSIIAGTGLTHDQLQATFRLQKSGGIVIHNFAGPGATMADLVFPGPAVIPGMNTAVPAVKLVNGLFGMYGVIIDLGMNDWGQAPITKDVFGSAYGAFLDAIPPSLKVACMGMTWTSTESALNSHGDTRDDFRATIKEVCEAHGHDYLDGLQAIPHNPVYFMDGLHPNDKGNRALGTFLAHALHALGWF